MGWHIWDTVGIVRSLKAKLYFTEFSFIIYFRALSSIIVLSSPCPYPNFTNVEWHKIIQENPYQLQKPIILPSISRALLEASRKHVVGEDSYMLPESSELSRAAARTFNDLWVKLCFIFVKTVKRRLA